MSENDVLREFKKSIIAFIDELITQFPNEGDLVIARIFLNDQIPIRDVMLIFNQKINQDNGKLRQMIKDRNEAFFLEHDIFDFVGKNKANHFKRLWRSGQLDDDDKHVVWKWIDSFVYLADRFIKLIS